MRGKSREFFVLGYVAGGATKAAKKKMTEVAVLLSRQSMVDIAVSPVPTYNDLTQKTARGEVDFAWLPAIPFLALHTQGIVVPLAAARNRTYASAIIVGQDSRLSKPSSLVGKRAAWVDRYSASGFVVPRVKLARLGIDPRIAFPSERFLGSHADVVRAVGAGEVDFGAVWANPGPRVTGPWAKTASDVRVLATFGNIPPDVIAARADLDVSIRKLVVRAIKNLDKDRGKLWLVRDVFGTDSFFRPEIELYEPLHEAVALAYRSGILEMPTPVEEEEDELDVAKTLEIRPKQAVAAAMRRISPDGTDEAEIIEVIEPSNPEIRLRPLSTSWVE
jgi:phosphate/phosphite/phosphonate ABC transporter binding protein